MQLKCQTGIFVYFVFWDRVYTVAQTILELIN